MFNLLILIKFISVCEGKSFNRETTAERFERSIGHQSSKPFSLFYNRLSDNPIFTERYNSLKCRKYKNIFIEFTQTNKRVVVFFFCAMMDRSFSEVDPFVRFLVRVREDKKVSIVYPFF